MLEACPSTSFEDEAHRGYIICPEPQALGDRGGNRHCGPALSVVTPASPCGEETYPLP